MPAPSRDILLDRLSGLRGSLTGTAADLRAYQEQARLLDDSAGATTALDHLAAAAAELDHALYHLSAEILEIRRV